MKKTLLLALALLSFACLHAQVYTSGRITVNVIAMPMHDSTTCASTCNVLYSITVDSSFIGDSVKIVDTNYASLIYSGANTTGASPWTFTAPISEYTPTLPDFAVSGGMVLFVGPVTKVICDYDTVAYITNNFPLAVSNPCQYGILGGNVYIDNNANCVFDSGDVHFGAVQLNIEDYLSSPTGSIPYDITATGSPYSYPIQQSWMTSYTVALPAYYAFIFPYSPCFSGYASFIVLPDTSIDFPLLCTSNVDVQCYALSPGSVRLHRAVYMQPYVSNTGCDTASGQLYFIKDSRMVYDPSLSTYPADIVLGDTLIWNYSNLSNLSSGAYWNSFLSDIYLTPDSTVVVGDTLCFRIYTNIPAADINPSNNDYSFCLPVVYSYDPNEKDVTPKGIGAQGYIPGGHDTLTYDMHFQNTGSDYAYNVTVTDTLDSHVNAASLRILGTSANMTPQWLTSNVVQFNFNGIYLPDSSANEAASHGTVRVSVALNNGLAPGTQIKNTAYIYFDTNPAVVTNTTLNTIDTVVTTITGVSQTVVPAVKVYPNPATDNITVENLAGGEIMILNLNGSVIVSKQITNDKTSIDLANLPSGVYILKTVNNDGTTTTKFTKY